MHPDFKDLLTNKQAWVWIMIYIASSSWVISKLDIILFYNSVFAGPFLIVTSFMNGYILGRFVIKWYWEGKK